MFKPLIGLVAIVAAFTIVGCSPNKEAQLEGKWKVQSMDLGSMANNPAAEQAAKEQTKDTIIEFKADKHFTMAGKTPSEGDWSLKDSTVTLNVTSSRGQSVDDLRKQFDQLKTQYPQLASKMGDFDKLVHQTATLSEDGKTLTIKNPGTGGGSATLTKV